MWLRAARDWSSFSARQRCCKKRSPFSTTISTRPRPKRSLKRQGGLNMFRALYTAASGMTAQQLNLDNVANNLANVSTSGFRKRRLQFRDLLYQNLVVPGSSATQQTSNAGLQIGLGTK